VPRDESQDDHAKILIGILALLAADRNERIEDKPPRRTEIVLAEAGLTPQEIANVVGGNPEAVRSTIRRAQATKTS
jgi:DNA-directed RNA polymerase specialized sigma24 family protein